MDRRSKYAIGIGAGLFGALLVSRAANNAYYGSSGGSSSSGSQSSASSTGGSQAQYTVTVTTSTKQGIVGQPLTFSVSVKPTLASGDKLALVNTSSGTTLYSSAQSTFTATITPKNAGTLAVEWQVLDSSGADIQHGAAVSVTVQACQSPYGCNPGVTPTNIPSGTKAVYQSGFGWVAQETQAQKQANAEKVIQEIVSGSPTGASESGAGAKQSAIALAQAYRKKYGGYWGVWQVGSTYYVEQSGSGYAGDPNYKGLIYSIGTKPAPAPTPTPAYTQSGQTSCPPGYTLQNGKCVINANQAYKQVGDAGAMPSGNVSMTPAQACQQFAAGQLPGPGFVVNGVWYPTLTGATAAAQATGKPWSVNQCSSGPASSNNSAPTSSTSQSTSPTSSTQTPGSTSTAPVYVGSGAAANVQAGYKVYKVPDPSGGYFYKVYNKRGKLVATYHHGSSPPAPAPSSQSGSTSTTTSGSSSLPSGVYG